MLIKRLFGAFCGGLVCATMLTAAYARAPDPVSHDSMKPTPSVNAAALIVDDDATVGHGAKVMVVFVDHGSPEIRKQVLDLLAFSDRHPEWIVDIKETPVLNPLSITTAEAEEAVIHQQNPEQWRQFEVWLDNQKNSNITKEGLRNAAKKSGVSMPDYDSFIADHHALSLPSMNRSLIEATKLHKMPVFFVNDKVVVGTQSTQDLEVITLK